MNSTSALYHTPNVYDCVTAVRLVYPHPALFIKRSWLVLGATHRQYPPPELAPKPQYARPEDGNRNHHVIFSPALPRLKSVRYTHSPVADNPNDPECAALADLVELGVPTATHGDHVHEEDVSKFSSTGNCARIGLIKKKIK